MRGMGAAEPHIDDNEFLRKYRGRLGGIMQWDDLSELWQRIGKQGADWFLYHVGDEVPKSPASPEQLQTFMTEVDGLLRREHEHDYCGIVYADDPSNPSFVKIYDPHNLGVVCGYSDNPPLPGWVMSRQPPVDLEQAFPPTGSRKRWWNKIFS